MSAAAYHTHVSGSVGWFFTNRDMITLDGGVVTWEGRSLESVRRDQAGLHSFLNMSLMDARRRNASALRLRFSQSFASRLHGGAEIAILFARLSAGTGCHLTFRFSADDLPRLLTISYSTC